jgi:mannosylglycerate synthase
VSLVVFPVKEEDPAVVVANLGIAAAHPRVEEVWAVISGAPADDIDHGTGIVEASTGKKVLVFPQERVGSFRPGKGDAMNTAILRSAERGFERTHFYDADITNFDSGWIDGAEDAADRGFSVVRHRFPRAATDAMITWMVTRPALAFLFPGTLLPRLGQPLGGELLADVDVVRALAGEDTVRERSDWGVDTMLTYATSALGTAVYEHDLADGKRHALYGSLWELRTMVLECLDAVASLAGRPSPPPGSELVSEPSSPVPDDLKNVRGFDPEATMALLTVEPANEEIDLAARLPDEVGERALDTAKGGEIEFMDADTWGTTLRFLLAEFELGDPAWEALAFRLWLIRVLAYANGPAREGYDRALDYLETIILHYEGQADQDVGA